MTEVKDELTESKATGFLPQKSAKMRWRKLGRCAIYIGRKKRAEDEGTLSLETGPTEVQHMYRALNVSRLEESSK